MDSLNFLLEDFIDQTVLLYHWDPFKRRARNSNCVEGPTATYTKAQVDTYQPLENVFRMMRKEWEWCAPDTSCTSSSEV